MEIANPSKLRKERAAWGIQGVVLAMAVIFSAFWLISLGFESPRAGLYSKNLPLPQLDLMKVGKGPLTLFSKDVSPELEPLVQDLVLVGKNTRPDGGNIVCLGLKSSGHKREMSSGQKLFLSKQGTYYAISEGKTDLAVLPLALSGNEVLLQITADPDIKEEFVLTPSSLFQRVLDDEAYVQALKKGKMWAPDLFLHQWGGEEYRDLSLKHKIEIGGKVYFLSVGDALWWDGEEWKYENLDGSPLAKLVSSTPQGVKIEVWDPTGYITSVVNIPLHQDVKMGLKVDEVITSVRPRSPGEITCQLGKRRVIVKEGDWWVKTDKRWRPLKTSADLEAFLHHEIQGELFIFEKIENSKGKTVLKGRSFDPMRTQSQSHSLVLNTEKKTPASRHKNEPSRASMLANNKMAAPPLQHQSGEGEEKQ